MTHGPSRLPGATGSAGACSIRRPLYPYFLGAIYAIAGRDLFLTRVCQAMIGASGCALLALAGRRLHSEKVGVIAGLGLAIYAPAIFFDGLLQKSVIDLFFVSLVIWLLSGLLDSPGLRLRWFALGLALGGLALTRENGLILIVPILLWRSAATGRVVAVADAEILDGGLCPWSAAGVDAGRRRAIGPSAANGIMTTSQFGPNFYLGNNADADGTARFLRQGRGAVEYERQDATDLAEAAEGRRLTPREISSFWTRQALAYIRANPWDWVKLEARKLMLLTNAAELIDTESQDSYEEWSPVLRVVARVGHFGFLATPRGPGDRRGMARSATALAVRRDGCNIRRERRGVLRVCALSVAGRAVSHALRGDGVVVAAELHTRSRQGQRSRDGRRHHCIRDIRELAPVARRSHARSDRE